MSFRLQLLHRERLRRAAILSRTALLAAALAMASVSLLAGCSGPDHDVDDVPAFVRRGARLQVPPGSPLRKRITVAPVVVRGAPHWLQVPGAVEADPAHTATVFAPLTGRVATLRVDIGDRVQRGQLLAVIDSGDMAQANADVVKARAALELARRDMLRERAVAAGGGAPIKDVEAAESAYAQARAEYARATERAASLGAAGGPQHSASIEVRAPISGSVTSMSIAAGVFVNDPTAPMLTIANIETVWITAEVPGDELRFVAPGAAARISVSAWPDRIFTGRVRSIAALLDPDTRRDAVRIAIDNPDRALKPNMFAQVALAVAQPPQVLVPQSAVLMNNDATTVFVETAPWTFARRAVKLGYDEGGDVRIVRGLEHGDRVIVAGAVLLNDD